MPESLSGSEKNQRNLTGGLTKYTHCSLKITYNINCGIPEIFQNERQYQRRALDQSDDVVIIRVPSGGLAE